MTYLGIVCDRASDFTTLAAASRVTVEKVAPENVTAAFLQGASALAILGGTRDDPLVLVPPVRVLVEDYLSRGGRVFAEFTASIGLTYSAPPVSTRFDRLVVTGDLPGLAAGDILDLGANARTNPYFTHSQQAPLLAFSSSVKWHSRVEGGQLPTLRLEDRGLWFEEPNLLVCSFSLCDFNGARFGPRGRWQALLGFILDWLCGATASFAELAPVYSLGRSPVDSPQTAAERAVAWFHRAGMLRDGGRGGMWEGLSTEIDPTGRQALHTTLRADCIGEAGLSFALHSLLTGDEGSREIAHTLQAYCFDNYQVREPGPYHGMVRWSDTGWEVCYQDDVARMLIPQMLANLYLGEQRHVRETQAALDFLVRTTGTDGTRVSRTDLVTLTEAKIAELASQPGNLPSAHYNAFYHAALLLAHRLYDRPDYAEVATRGLTTIMAVYPDTRREQSETEALCRLVLPLAWLYWVTGDEQHRKWLYRVTDDLERLVHPTGAYLEWDTGYTAARSRTTGDESALLMHNGDPVVDLLYANNWLPMGFIQAYFVTRDDRFLRLWQRTAAFMASVQLSSADPLLDGAWPRAIDVELHEVFAAPNDIGWGPWSVESGWTVAEIASGLMAGCLAGRLAQHYRG